MIAGGGADGCVYIHDLRSSKNVTKLRVPPVGARRSRIVNLHPLSSARQLITSSMNSKVIIIIIMLIIFIKIVLHVDAFMGFKI